MFKPTLSSSNVKRFAIQAGFDPKDADELESNWLLQETKNVRPKA